MTIKRFWTDRSGAVASEFVMLSAALVMGVSVTLTTLTSSLGFTAQTITEEMLLAGCAPHKQAALANQTMTHNICN